MNQPGKRTVRCCRAQVSPVAVVLLLVLVLAGSTAVAVLGATAVGQSQDSLSEQRAEKAATQFDSKAALVALGNSDTQQVDFGYDRRSSYEVNEGEGWLRIVVENQTDGTSTEVVNESLGTMTYEVDNRTIAYQSGGVWKRVEGNESVMVSPPEFYFRDGTLTLPVVNTTGAASVGSTASISHEETVEKYPNAAAGNENPLRNHLVKVTVQSQYYKGWGRYFEERTDGDVAYDHGRNVVNLTLVSPVGLRRITAATSSLSASGSFEIKGSAGSACSGDGDDQNGNKEMYTNSYNSSKSGDYCDQASNGNYSHKGDIIYGEDINISYGSGGNWIHGDVESGGDVTVSGSMGSGQTSVYGSINHTDACNPSVADCQARVENTSSSVNDIDGIPTERQIDYYVDHEIEDINESGNPSGAPIDSNDRLQFDASGEVELTSGRYILEEIDPSTDDEIVLNTTDGTVVVAVREDVSIPENTNISVEGNGTALMFVGNESSSQWAFEMAHESAVRNDGDEADQFRLYGKENMNVRIGDGGGGSNNQAKFVGVIYTPPGNDGNGTVVLDKGEVFGGIVTGTTVIETKSSIHYDEALKQKKVINPDANVLKVTYLHVSVNQIRVD